MKLSLNTRVHDLIEQHPFLLDYLTAYNPAFQKLRNPALRATLGRIATLEMAAKMGAVVPAKLLEDVSGAIEKQTGRAPERAEAPSPEREAARREVLKDIIRDLHAGGDQEELKKRLASLLDDVGGSEIGRMEQELVAQGLPVSEIHRLCDIHVAVMKPALQKQAPEGEALPAGHPIHTFRAENRAFEKVCLELGLELQGMKVEGPTPERGLAIVNALELLGTIERHYQRKENQLFPFLEKKGVSAPPQVMWAVHDQIRAQLKQARAAAAAFDAERLVVEGNALIEMVRDMIFKEENILFPMCQELLTEEEFAEIRRGEGEIGYALVEPPPSEWKQPGGEEQSKGLHRLPLDTGLLSLEQVNLMLSHLPVEVSFVDENDEVRFYSGGEKRIFPRSPAVIGRKVQHCHPPKSQHIVNRILAEFRAGTRKDAEFWIQLRGKFLLIRYYAMRDAQGVYKGTLEVTQDVTGIRALEGEQRLLDWDAAQSTPTAQG